MPIPAWEEIEQQASQLFPDLDPREMRQRYEQARRLETTRLATPVETRAESIGLQVRRSALPFVSSIEQTSRNIQYQRARQRMNAGNPEQRDYQIIANYETDQERESGRGYVGQAANIVTHLPSFGGEFAATGPLFWAGRGLAMRGTTAALGRGAESLAGRGTSQVAGYLAGTAAQTVANPQRVVQDASQRALSEGGDTFSPRNLGRGFLDTMIELGSERAGAAIPFAGTQLGRVPIIGRVRDAWLRTRPGETIASFNRALTSTLQRHGVPYHGLTGEVFEERVGEVLRGITQLEPDYGTVGDILTGRLGKAGEQLLVEGLAFAAVPIAYGVATRAMRRGGMSTAASRERILQVGGLLDQQIAQNPNITPEEAQEAVDKEFRNPVLRRLGRDLMATRRIAQESPQGTPPVAAPAIAPVTSPEAATVTPATAEVQPTQGGGMLREPQITPPAAPTGQTPAPAAGPEVRTGQSGALPGPAAPEPVQGTWPTLAQMADRLTLGGANLPKIREKIEKIVEAAETPQTAMEKIESEFARTRLEGLAAYAQKYAERLLVSETGETFTPESARELIRQAGVTEREFGVLTQRQAHGERPAQTDKEIGAELRVSDTRVQQIEVEALTKLKKYLGEDFPTSINKLVNAVARNAGRADAKERGHGVVIGKKPGGEEAEVQVKRGDRPQDIPTEALVKMETKKLKNILKAIEKQIEFAEKAGDRGARNDAARQRMEINMILAERAGKATAPILEKYAAELAASQQPARVEPGREATVERTLKQMHEADVATWTFPEINRLVDALGELSNAKVHQEVVNTFGKDHGGTLIKLGKEKKAGIVKEVKRELYERLGQFHRNDPATVEPARPDMTAAEVSLAPAAAHTIPLTEAELRALPGGGQEGSVGERPMRVTALEKDVIFEERRKLGLPDVPEAETIPDKVAHAKAKAKMDANPRAGEALVEDVLTTRRPVSFEDKVLLVRHKVAVENEYHHAMIEYLNAVRDKADPATISEIDIRASLILNQIDRIGQVAKLGGSESGRSLRFQRVLVAEDFSLVGLTFRKMKAKGSELTPDERVKITEQSQKIKDLQDKIDILQSGIEEGKDKPTGKDIGNLAQRLAKKAVKYGMTDREAVIDRVHAELNDLGHDMTRRETMDAISGYGKYVTLNKEEAAALLRDLKGQMQQLAKLEDMAMKLNPKKTGFEHRIPSPAESLLIKEVKEKMKEGGFGPYSMEAKNKSLGTSMKNKIAELQDRLARGDFDPPRKPDPIVLSKENTELKFQLETLKKEINQGIEADRLARRTLAEKTWDRTIEALNLHRIYYIGLDMGTFFRQGGLFLAGNPIKAIKHGIAASKAAATRKSTFEMEQEMKDLPAYKDGTYKRGDLDLSSTGGPLFRREEAFRSTTFDHLPGMIDKIPGQDTTAGQLATLPLRIPAETFAYLQRWTMAHMNFLRVNAFDMIRASGTADGVGTTAELQIIGNAVNVLTGRGSLGTKGEKSVELLSAIFFSPRYVMSRLQYLALQPLWHKAGQGSPQLRLAIAKELYAKPAIGLAAFLSLVALAAKSGLIDADVELDRRSTDFGKIRIGNTRLDPFAGLQQAFVFLSRVQTGETKTLQGEILPSYGEGSRSGQKSWDVITRFVRGKFSPAFGTGVDTITRETLMGEPFGPLHSGRRLQGTAAVGRRLFVPLSASDMYEAFKDLGFSRGFAVSLWAWLGGGVQSHNRLSRR